VGPSGSGKTSLLKILGGFLRPDGGVVSLSGSPLLKPSPRAVMVFQEFDQLFPWKRVRENVAFPLRVHPDTPSPSDIAERVSSILREVGLAGYERYFPFQLSGGMKQRVALARALISEAPVLLMDEPFGSLDAMRREDLQQLLLRMWKEHALSVVFVTHDITEALLLADTVLVLSPRMGEDSREDGSPEHPRSAESSGAPGTREDGLSHLEIPVDLPRPRSPMDLRFSAYYRRIYRLL